MTVVQTPAIHRYRVNNFKQNHHAICQKNGEINQLKQFKKGVLVGVHMRMHDLMLEVPPVRAKYNKGILGL